MMHINPFLVVVWCSTLVAVVHTQKLILTNDDGWATAQIRDQYASLQAAKYDVSAARSLLRSSSVLYSRLILHGFEGHFIGTRE